MSYLQDCESCIHWSRRNEERGWCKFNAPVIDADGDGVWPLTSNDDWCSHQEDAPMPDDAKGRPVDRAAYDRLLSVIAKYFTGPANAKGRSEIWRRISGEADIAPSNFYRMVAQLAENGRLVAVGKMYHVPAADEPQVEELQ